DGWAYVILPDCAVQHAVGNLGFIQLEPNVQTGERNGHAVEERQMQRDRRRLPRFVRRRRPQEGSRGSSTEHATGKARVRISDDGSDVATRLAGQYLQGRSKGAVLEGINDDALLIEHTHDERPDDVSQPVVSMVIAVEVRGKVVRRQRQRQRIDDVN